jgi:2-amino-4-hydroxy-6-hydroxymethyldihydropteridine diphosphokinase
VEAEFDRLRVVRWGPRTLDIDIITVDGEHGDDPELTLPHPRAHERAFVLAPWHDVDPDAVLPGYGPVADLLKSTDQTGIRREAVFAPGGQTPRMGGTRPPSPLAPHPPLGPARTDREQTP